MIYTFYTAKKSKFELNAWSPRSFMFSGDFAKAAAP